MCVAYSKIVFLNLWLRTAQWVKILNSESFQLQLSIRQSLGEWHYGYKQRNKVTLIVCVIQIIDRKQKKLTTISEFGVAVPTSNFPNDIANIVRVFNIGSPKLWNDLTPSTQKPLWNSVRRMKKYLHTLENYTYGLKSFNVSIVFGHFRQKLNFAFFWKKTAKFHRSKERTHVGWLVLAQKKYPLKFGSFFYEITVFSL